MDEITFGDVRRNRDQIIRVKLVEFDGRGWVTLETWAKGLTEDAQGTFTGKKFTLHATVWEELCPLIESAAADGIRRYPGGGRRRR